jgi:hypothetical protein
MSLKARVAGLEKLLPPPARPHPLPKQRAKRVRLVEKRLSHLVEEALRTMTVEQRGPVEAALGQWIEEQNGPYSRWFWDLGSGNCRLPEIPAQVMKELLLAWLSPEIGFGVPVCRQCGLEYPHRQPPLKQWKLLPGKVPCQGPPPWYDLPTFFGTCPGCGASAYDIDWSHQVPSRPWMEWDGCV